MMQVVPHNHSHSLKRQLETEVTSKRISQQLILHSPIDEESEDEENPYVPPALLTEEHFRYLQEQIIQLKDILLTFQLTQ